MIRGLLFANTITNDNYKDHKNNLNYSWLIVSN